MHLNCFDIGTFHFRGTLFGSDYRRLLLIIAAFFSGMGERCGPFTEGDVVFYKIFVTLSYSLHLLANYTTKNICHNQAYHPAFPLFSQPNMKR